MLPLMIAARGVHLNSFGSCSKRRSESDHTLHTESDPTVGSLSGPAQMGDPKLRACNMQTRGWTEMWLFRNVRLAVERCSVGRKCLELPVTRTVKISLLRSPTRGVTTTGCLLGFRATKTSHFCQHGFTILV